MVEFPQPRYYLPRYIWLAFSRLYMAGKQHRATVMPDLLMALKSRVQSLDKIKDFPLRQDQIIFNKGVAANASAKTIHLDRSFPPR